MKPFAWSKEKKTRLINAQLMTELELCFEAVVVAIEAGERLDVLEHPNQARYPGQRILVGRIHGDVHIAPYIEAADHLFLKTVIPSRKAHVTTKITNATNFMMEAMPLGHLKNTIGACLKEAITYSLTS
jgi:hypothetical protein